MSQPAPKSCLLSRAGQEVEWQTLPLPLLGPLILLCLMWAVVTRDETGAVEEATHHSGGPGEPDSGRGRRKPLVQLAKAWRSAGLNYALCRPLSSHRWGNNYTCAGPGACGPVGWTDAVISSVLRLLKKFRLFMNVYWSGVGWFLRVDEENFQEGVAFDLTLEG